MAASMSVSPVEVVVAVHICLDVIPVLHGPAKIEPGRGWQLSLPQIATGDVVW